MCRIAEMIGSDTLRSSGARNDRNNDAINIPLLRSEGDVPLLRSEGDVPLLRSEEDVPLLRSEEDVPLLRSEAAKDSN